MAYLSICVVTRYLRWLRRDIGETWHLFSMAAKCRRDSMWRCKGYVTSWTWVRLPLPFTSHLVYTKVYRSSMVIWSSGGSERYILLCDHTCCNAVVVDDDLTWILTLWNLPLWLCKISEMSTNRVIGTKILYKITCRDPETYAKSEANLNPYNLRSARCQFIDLWNYH
jgi:hypothetical protein